MQQGFSFYLVLLAFIFFDVAYASLTLSVQQASCRLVLEDVGIPISEEIFSRFDFFKSGFHFNSEAPCTLQDIDFDTWKKLNKPFTEDDCKVYFKNFTINDLYTIKSYYDFLQMNKAIITNALSYTILKKVLPKGTLTLFYRSIASEVFYKNDKKGFDADLQDQFKNFIIYCTVLWKKVAFENRLDARIIDVSAVLQDRYSKKTTDDKQYIFKDKLKKLSTKEKDNVYVDYLKKKMFLDKNLLDLSFVMISENLKHYGYPSFLSYWLSKENMSLADTDAKLSLVQKVVYCYTKNIRFADLREDCNNISSIECKALDGLTLNFFDNTSLNPILWQKRIDNFLFKPLQTIIVDQQSNEKLRSQIPELKKQYYIYKMKALKKAICNHTCLEIIDSSLVLHHFLCNGLSFLVSSFCMMPTIVNYTMTIFDVQFVNNAQQVASLLFSKHEMTKTACLAFGASVFLVEFCRRSFFGNQHYPTLEESIGALFFFVTICDYIYYFYALYQAGFDAVCLYDVLYIITVLLMVKSALYSIQLKRACILNDFNTLWRILWHTKCPQVIINE